MPWWYAVVEARRELRNSTTADKIRPVGADDPDAAAFRERGRGRRDPYVHWVCDLLGRGIFVCRVP
jgi:hypothetical protein